MFGVVCTNPVTGCVEPWTIAGPTDGSTNIVHHDENRDYQLATANDCQYGASYLGITDCCKPLYNPSTGNLTVDCATTTATGVDVNADDNVDVAHPIIAQNYDCDDTEFKNKLIKASCFNYNPQCYVCNDPVTGDPVRKPVVHIGTLCADEYLGFNEGLPRRTNVCEDCWRQIPFIGEDNGGETLDTTWSCDAFRHNSCTCTTKMIHLELTDICSCGDIYVGDRAFNPNTFEYYTKDPTNAFNTRYAGFASMAGGFNLYDCDTTNNRCRYRLSLSESNSAIETNALTIGPVSNASLGLTLTSLPYTCNTENIAYTPMVVNSSYGYVKKMDGFSYDPATCYLCGNFCGNINIWPYECCSAYSANCMEATADCFKVSICDVSSGRTSYYCFGDDVYLNAAYTGFNSILAMQYGITRLSTALSSNSNCRCSDLFLNECNACLHAVCKTYIGGDCWVEINSYNKMEIRAKCNTSFYDNGRLCTLRCESGGQCTEIINDYNELKFTSCCCGAVIAIHDIYTCNAYSCPNRLAVCCDANVGWQAYALMCDLSAAGGRSQITTPSTLAALFTALGDINGTPTHINDPNISFTATDYIGNTISVCHLLGFVTRPESTMAQFVGVAATTSGKKYHLDMWFNSNGGVECDWTIVTPVPGTLYGSASASGINVEGAV